MIAICPNPYRDADLDYSRRALQMLSEEGFESIICPVFAEEGEEILPRDVSYHSLKELGDDCTLLIVIGSQKTISITTEKLHTRRAYLSVDGNSVMDLCSGDRMIVRRSAHRTLMVRIHDKTFFETAYEKL